MSEPARSSHRGLTRETFDRLLAAFDPDRAAAGEKYERLRARLTRFFSWEGASAPEDLADEAFNRTASRLAEGEPIRDAAGYLLGVSRLLLKEDVKRRRRTERVLSDFGSLGDPEPPDEALADCLERCLARLSPDSRSLILSYYSGDKRSRIDNRKRMSEELGVEMNALRNRALRLRDKLEHCVNGCRASGQVGGLRPDDNKWG
jgi:DNA-directed RNA polymerase specialized sigma24 family protein